ncbi:MAG TPA: hypothetical protein VH054_07740, partial [Polyangiaceae bacterium]|nr:hypothetical protein [Polyangiaceae bacterium]
DATAGAAWSNPNGWGVEKYYGTVRCGGAMQKKITPPKTGSDGGTSPPGSDGGNDGDNGSGGGCSMSNGDRDSSGVAWLAIGLALALASRLRVRRAR